MLVISILRMVGPANVSTSVGTGVSVIFKNWLLLGSCCGMEQ